MGRLAPVVAVDAERCVNCHACIAVCPVKFCNDGSGDFIAVRDDQCIGCGSCLEACTHGARRPVDDGAEFWRQLGQQPLVAVAAPAVAASFPGQELRLNGWLASVGVDAVFDVSFGAELTVKSYLEHLKTHPKAVIAQPCPAVVTYIQLHRPELLPYLAPADSPMAHTVKLIDEFFPRYRDHRIVVLSPCVAKRREFNELGWGERVLNLTLKSLDEGLRARQVKLDDYAERPYDGPAAERAVEFSTPGGLQRTAEREVPTAARFTRKIEGPRTIYPYLDQLYRSIDRGENPLLIDGLNCEHGCNGGPGTLVDGLTVDELEARIARRSRAAQAADPKRKSLSKALARFWKPGLFERQYAALTDQARLSEPTAREVEEVYGRMAKRGAGDEYNCNSCGYGSCRQMAVAIHNGLNRPENCHHFNLEQVKVENARVKEEEEKLAALAAEAAQVAQAVEAVAARVAQGSQTLGDRSAALAELSEAGEDRNREVLARLAGLGERLGGLNAIVKTILDLARRSNLLSVNATIEASRAGKQGAAFAVVADEVKKMAVQTQAEAKKIQPFAEALLGEMDAFEADLNRTFDDLGRQGALVGDLTALAGGLKESAADLQTKARELGTLTSSAG